MKTTQDLLDEIVNRGFKWHEVIEILDKSLDDELGFMNRRPLDEEYLPDELYNTILETFKEEGEMDD
nr:MAG TPA: hypothetical protein [Caudoviricetes sp.]